MTQKEKRGQFFSSSKCCTTEPAVYAVIENVGNNIFGSASMELHFCFSCSLLIFVVEVGEEVRCL